MRGRLYLLCLACMALGVYAGRHLAPAALAAILASTLFACLLITLKKPRLTRAVSLPAAFMIVGALLMFFSVWQARHGLLYELATRRCVVSVEGRVVSPHMRSGEGASFFAEVSSVTVKNLEHTCAQRALIRVEGPISENRYYPGSKLIARGKLSAPGRNAGWLLERGAACSLDVEPAGLLPGKGGADAISRSVHAGRLWISSCYRRLFGEEEAGLMEGVTLSRLDGLDAGLLEDLRDCGLSHIVAVSGLHVGSVAILTLALMSAIGAGKRGRYLAASSMAVLALAMSNFRPSALRATLMGVMGFGGILLGREYDSLAGLSLAGMLILCANPRSLFDQGLQLSFAAALGIVLVAGRCKGATGARLALAVCAAAQLGTLPLMLLRGEGQPVTAIAANLLVVPVVGPLLMAGWFVAALSSVSGWLAGYISVLPAAAAKYIIAVASVCAGVPRAGLYGPVTAVMAFLLYVMGLIGMVRQARDAGSIFKPFVACALAVLLMLLPCITMTGVTGGGNSMTALDIGEGDATLLRDRTGATALIDGGPDGRMLLEKLQRKGIRKLDLIVLTHPHSDHLDGLVEVSKRLPVGALLEPGLPAASGMYRELLESAEKRRIRRMIAREGQVVRVSELMELEVLYAPRDLREVPDEMNDCSVVIMARIGEMKALLTGDIGDETQETLMGLHPDLSCEVLKVPHHGAREASSAEFLSACRPAVATISAGEDNRFGHPSRLCLQLLESRGMRVARTDRQGDIEISVDNGRIGLATGRR